MAHRTTWICPERVQDHKDKYGNIRRNTYINQIDYIMTRTRYMLLFAFRDIIYITSSFHLDLFRIYALKHTGVIIYLTILLQERTVILYQIAPSQISSQITVFFMLLYNVYAPIQFENR